MNTASETLAAAVEQARLELNEAELAYQAVVERADGIRAKIAGLETQRAEIIESRASGKIDPDEAARFAILGADADHLRELLTLAESEAAQLEPSQARTRLQRAESDWKRHEAEQVISALQDRAKRLESTLVACLAELARTAASAGHQNMPEIWTPGDGLRMVVAHTRLATISTLGGG